MENDTNPIKRREYLFLCYLLCIFKLELKFIFDGFGSNE